MHIEMPNVAPMCTQGFQPWADKVEKVTNGAVKIEIFPLATLMSTKDAFEGVKSRIADVSWLFVDVNPGRFGLMEATELPFMMPESAEVGSLVLWNLYQKYPEAQKQFEGVKVLLMYSGEPQYFCASNKNFKTVSDFQGMKIRAVGSMANFVELAGGVPINIGTPDVYLNVEKGVIDGSNCSSEALTAWRLYEVAPYITFVPVCATTQLIIMNNEVWNEMPPNIQEAIMSVSGETGAAFFGREIYDKGRGGLKDKIKDAGYNPTYYTVPQEEVSKWAETAKPIYDDWLKKMADKGLTSAKQILDDIPVLVKQYSNK